MRPVGAPLVKFGIFATVMIALTAFLFMIFNQYRGGATTAYSAVFSDASRLKTGDSVRAAGIRVGTVNSVALRGDRTVVVDFDADRNVVLTTGTKAAVRYLNLVGDRYLELADGPGSTRILGPGTQIPLDHTAPALDIDLLIGGLKPVTQGLNPQDVNALTQSLLYVLQGQGQPLQSLLANTSSFTNALADNDQVVQQLIDNLNTVAATLSSSGGQFSATVDRLQRFVSGLSADRDPIGAAIQSLDNGTASLADLLAHARTPLAGTINELNRLVPQLDLHKDHIDAGLQREPDNLRKLVRLGAYGSFYNYYLCGVQIRVTDLQGATAVFPWIRQQTGRCADN
ncbi:MAG: MCE family protein [Mycobacterium sp.]|uniref:MCE family protein n=1 Tax=Mycobacterium sp. TaxID=1785 RepID=UPI001EBA4D3E|nr:MCE family protein [Mycobacterium sp.]MBW0018092.1 MCE family protein [Mycobacterium sp.]